MAESIQFELDITGEETVNRALEDVTKKLDSVEQATKKTAAAEKQLEQANTKVATSLKQTAQPLQQANGKLNQLGSTLGIAGQALGKFSTSGGQMISILGQATGAVSALGAGFGPLGFAIAGGVTALGLLATAFQDTKSDADKLVETVGETLPEAINKAAVAWRAWQQSMNATNQIASGIGASADERTEIIRRQEASLRGLKAERDRLADDVQSGRVFSTSRLDALEEQINRAERELQLARNTLEATNIEGSATSIRSSAGGARRAAPRSSERSLESLMGPSDVDLARLRGGFEAGQDLSMATSEPANSKDAERDQITALYDYRREKEEEYNDWQTRQSEAKMEMYSAEIEAVGALGEAVGATVTDIFDTILSGEKVTTKAIAKGIGDQLKGLGLTIMNKGIGHLLEASFLTASGINYAAAAGIPIAIKEIAFGAGLGAVGAGVSAAAGSGRGGGGGGDASSRPQRDRESDSDQARVINVYWNQPAILADTYAQAGRQVRRAIAESETRYG